MTMKSTTFTLASAMVPAACVYPNGDPNRSANGALIGGLTGAAIGNAFGGDTRSTVIGGVVGAARDGVIGEDLARQERELSQVVAGTGAMVTNTGSQVQVILPEAVSLPNGLAKVNSGPLPALRELARSLRADPNSTVLVVGHTDNVGAAAFDRQLSLDRASAVARSLAIDGVSSRRITFAGRGYDQLIASNSVAGGRAQNRRVEVLITPTS